MSSATDEELLRRYADGDREAFAALVERYERRVYAIAFRMCGDVEDARDVSQDVFVSAMSALRRFRHEASLGTWFHRLAVNASLDRLRRRARRRESPLQDAVDRPASEPGPDEQAVAGDRASQVQLALMKLSPDHRAVLVLHDLYDLDYPEVAAALDIPLGTVKSRIHRARADLARHLGHLRQTEPHPPSEPLTER